jgi:hypothetical protein
MKSLVKVSFDGTRVTAAGLRRLRVLPRLRQMSFSKVKLAGNEYEDLLDLMPRRVELLHDRRSDLGRAAEKA